MSGIQLTPQRIRILKALLAADAPLKNADIAQQAGTTYECVGVLLRQLKSLGWVEVVGRDPCGSGRFHLVQLVGYARQYVELLLPDDEVEH